ncbi:MAG TPA: hypothetical protein VIC08_01380 [Cellvibrionaceae bacterium]
MRPITLAHTRGQAMTEFVVSVAFIFMVLFVAVPMFGKLMDIKFQNLQASRYAAWERTVWLQDRHAWNTDNLAPWVAANSNSNDFVISNAEFESIAVRNNDDLANTVRNRFFYGHGRSVIKPISAADTDGSGGPASPLWTYVQSRQPMLAGVQVLDTQEQDTNSVAYDVIGTLGGTVNAIAAPVNFLMGALGAENDDLLNIDFNMKGYYSPQVRASLNTAAAKGGGSGQWDRVDGQWGSGIEDMIYQNWDGVFTANSAILADGWNAQSVGYFKDRVDNLVLSTVFDNAVFDVVKTIASILEGGPGNSAIHKIDFGDIQVNPMPGENGQPLPVTCDGGFCYYDD